MSVEEHFIHNVHVEKNYLKSVNHLKFTNQCSIDLNHDGVFRPLGKYFPEFFF